MEKMKEILELINPEGILDPRIIKAQGSFWEYCRIINPKFFCSDRSYLKELCDTLQGIFEGTIRNHQTGLPYKNLMINIPPRHGKSYTLTLFVQWCMGKRNDTRVISVSYNDILAGRFARNVRDGIDADKLDSRLMIFKDIFPTTQIKRGDASAQLWSLEGQFFNYLASGFGGTITGIGCSMGIIDDPIKNDQEAFNDRVLEEQWSWYTDTFLSRIEEGGMQIIVMTRWSTKDLCGRLLNSEDREDWYVFCRPACLNEKAKLMLCPSLLSYRSYAQKRRLTSPEIADANYQQQPVDIKGKLYGQFRTYTELPRENGKVAFEQIISYTDTADTGTDDLCSIAAGVYQGEARIESYKGGAAMKEATQTTEPTAEKKEMGGQINEEMLEQLLEQAAQRGAEAALQAMNASSADAKEGAPGEQQEQKTEEKSAKAPADPPAAKAQRKYADIYMNTGSQPKEEKSTMAPGIGWVRYQKCMMRANKDYDHAAHIAKHIYGDEGLERQIKAMSITSPSDGGYLVPEVYASEIIPLLRDKAIVLKLGATELPMDNGNLNIPKMLSGVSAGYVGELKKAQASKAKFGNLHLSSKKLMCKVLVSNDLIRSNAYGADQLILNDATTAMALAMDKAALMGRGNEFEPLGLLKSKKIPTVALSDAPDEATTGKLLAKLIQANADTSRLGWALNGYAWQAFYNVVGGTSGLYLYRDQMNAGKLNGHEFAISNQIEGDSSTSIILGNWAEYMIGRQGSMESEMFREGSVTDEDGNTVSAVDQDCTILRIIDLHDFGVRHEESFVVGTGLTVG